MRESDTAMAGLKNTPAVANLKAMAERKLRRLWRTVPPEQRTQIRAAVHPADVVKVQQIVKTPNQKPRVSVIILATEQAQGVSTTLRSLLGQKPSAMEIIVIDIVEGESVRAAVLPFATRDVRIKYMSAPDMSEPEARARAVSSSRAPYILFLMAGDVVEKSQLDLFFQTARETGSDMVVGMSGVTKGKIASTPAWQRKLHGERQLALVLAEAPEVLLDGFLSNKLFSREFWTEQVAPVAADQGHWQYEAMRVAYARATTFDLLDVKLSNTSQDDAARVVPRELLCQQQYLEDRLKRLESLAAMLGQDTSPELYQRWLSHELGIRLFRFFEVVPRTDETYWESLQSTVSRLADDHDLDWAAIPLHNRLILASVLANNRVDVERICNNRSDYGSSFATSFTDNQLLAQPAYLSELSASFDPELLVCQDVDLRMISKLTHFTWLTDGRLEIGGHTYISSVDPVAGGMIINAALLNIDETIVLPLEVARASDPTIDWESNDNWTSYAETSFRTVIDPRQLLETAEYSEVTAWHIRLTLRAYDRTLEGIIAGRDLTGSTGQLDVGPMMGTERLAVEMRPGSTGLTLVRVVPMYMATVVELKGRTLELTVQANSAPLAAKIAVECAKFGIRKTATCISVDGNTAKYSVKIPQLAQDAGLRTEYEWQLRLDSGFKAPQPVAWPLDSQSLREQVDGTQSLRVRLTGYGFIAIEERRTRVIASSIDVSADQRVLTVKGTADLPVIHTPRFVLSSGKAVIPATNVSLDLRTDDGSNAFVAEFDLPQRPWGDEELMPESGAYSVRYVPPGVDDTLGYWFPAGEELQRQMPRRIDAGRTEVGITRSSRNAALTVHLRPPLAHDELGRFNQQAIRLRTVQQAPHDLRDAVLFMCFGGRRATDSPRRLLEEYQRRGSTWPMYWAISDYSVPVPAGTSPVLIGSKLWYRLLGEVRILINNNNFPFYFRKREGQEYIQTWHGTPLKKLGNDVARTNFSLSYWNLMWREADYWDALLAQNDYAAEVLAKCFGFDGRVVAEGYPRNDSLTSDRMALARPAIREKLGIPEGKTAILYAPTWRDDAKNDSKQYEMVTYLDFEAAQRLLGNNYVILLRGHHNIAGQRQTAANKFVIDVTEYPEVNDLYTAADILVNDYSSVMFDFCVTGKPIIFLTPDIAQYRDATRGFYFDLEEKAPGPLHNTTEEVVRSIKNISSVSRRYAKRYSEFVQTFAPHCDGNATRRVFDALISGDNAAAASIEDQTAQAMGSTV
ncbi:bifunctional glycosyltransferase/CDP-glycerol:glycerophosphate glycerophosphotransferase [Arthrobacter sp. A5]|uniref:bifunctional glycosyltransferase/CDP-glycerol:glycerophosphate glycerophosphotransferase n=1 Tax=Arthrobacter sp. A5 TaxID=576926 RepID=UPI003DA975D7